MSIQNKKDNNKFKSYENIAIKTEPKKLFNDDFHHLVNGVKTHSTYNDWSKDSKLVV